MNLPYVAQVAVFAWLAFGVVVVLVGVDVIAPSQWVRRLVVGLSVVGFLFSIAYFATGGTPVASETQPLATREVKSAAAGKCTVIQATERVSVSSCETGIIIFIK